MGNKVSVGGRTVQIVRQIGEGGQAFVYEARDCATGDLFALKRILFRESSERREIEREVQTHQLLSRHRNVVSLHGHATHEPSGGNPGEVVLLMDLCRGSLPELLQHAAPLPEARIVDVFAQVADAVCFMHSQRPPIAHRDLKVENVLLRCGGGGFINGEEGTPVLCDFGSATTTVLSGDATREQRSALESDVAANTTLECRAPELVELHHTRARIDEKVDVWALGCMLYRMCYGDTPFGASGLRIVTGTFEFPESPRYSAALRAIVSAALVVDPAERLSAFEINGMVCALRGVPNSYQRFADASAASRKKRAKTQAPPVQEERPATPVRQQPQQVPTAQDQPFFVGSSGGSPAVVRLRPPRRAGPIQPHTGAGDFFLPPPPAAGHRRAESYDATFRVAASSTLAPQQQQSIFQTPERPMSAGVAHSPQTQMHSDPPSVTVFPPSSDFLAELFAPQLPPAPQHPQPTIVIQPPPPQPQQAPVIPSAPSFQHQPLQQQLVDLPLGEPPQPQPQPQPLMPTTPMRQRISSSLGDISIAPPPASPKTRLHRNPRT